MCVCVCVCVCVCCGLIISVMQNKLYPTEDVRPRLKNRKINKPARLRKSIQPGQVLILLANAHRGKVSQGLFISET